jgi:hypothetical protein
MINCSDFLVTDWFPKRGMTKKQRYIDDNFIDLRGRDLRCLNGRFVSRRGVSLDSGTDVRYIFYTLYFTVQQIGREQRNNSCYRKRKEERHPKEPVSREISQVAGPGHR